MSAQEIREALEAHAQFEDTAALARIGAVKTRVRAVRRRRRAALAGAAAAVIATVGGVATLLPGSREVAPADRVFGDLTAPATMTSEGATYEFSTLVVGKGEVRFTDDIEGPFLVSWASAGDGPVTVTKTLDGEDQPYRSVQDFRDFVAVQGNDEQTIQLVGTGRLALAVYTLASPAPGTRADIDGTPVVFRDELPGFRAIGSAWAEPGATDLTMTFAYPRRTLEISSFCTAPKGYDLYVDLGDGPVTWGQCNDTPSVSGPGNRFGLTDGLQLAGGRMAKAGDRVTAHLWLAKAHSDRPVAGPVPGVRIGVGAYETEPTVGRIGVWGLTELREEAGHTWRFVRVARSDGDQRTFSVPLEASDRPRIVVFTAAPRAGTAQVFLDGAASTMYEDSTGGGGFLATAGPLGSGSHTVELRTQHPAEVGMAVYEQVD